jgi:hypothetical protein
MIMTAHTLDYRLIKAAPDLLEALRGLIACCEQYPAFNNPRNVLTISRLNAARAAIAKAEGKS